jgi:hypothetical protein
MKIISIILAITFTMNVFAAAAPMKELESAMDNYQYALTVEWDQKDMAFKNQQTEIFSKKMDELFKSGLTSEDVKFLVDTRFKDSKVAEAAKMKLSLLGNKLTPANVLDILKTNAGDVYSQGASWTGNAEIFVWGGVIVAIIAIAVAYSSWHDANYTCTKTAIADYCTDNYDCWSYDDSRYSSGSCSYSYTNCGSYERCIKEERNGYFTE